MNHIQKIGSYLRAKLIELVIGVIKLALGGGAIFGVIFAIGYFQYGDAYWYSITEGAAIEKVTIEKKPHDCEFSTAPLGEKNCHYEKVMSKVMWATSVKGDPIVSDDDGKTWYQPTWAHDPGTPKFPVYPKAMTVYIFWKKVED